jgi:hypothetical protein
VSFSMRSFFSHATNFAAVFMLGFLGNAISLRAQDTASFADVAYANAESMRNYDVSCRETYFAEIPQVKSDYDNFVKRLEQEKVPLWDEKRLMSRLVIDKGGGMNPERLFFVKEGLVFWQKKIIDRQFSFVLWKDGTEIHGFLRGNGETGVHTRKRSIGKTFFWHRIPCFDSYDGSTMSPPESFNFWEDHANYWEIIKSESSDWSVFQSRSGRLQMERKAPDSHRVSYFDPVSLLLTGFRIVGIDPTTGEADPSQEIEQHITWENMKSVYVLKSEVVREPTAGMVMSNGTSAYHWHHLNEDDFKFPFEIADKVTVEESMVFLTEGQSELLEGSSGEK